MGIAQPEQDDPAGPASASDAEALAALYVRHERAIRGLATTFLGAGDHGDLVRVAFERTLATTRPGDTDGSFCARWFVTLRALVAAGDAGDVPGASAASGGGRPSHLHAARPDGLRHLPGPVIAPARRDAVLLAFGRLPGRMQTVLWQTEVEARSPLDVAARLGMTPTAVLALSMRARTRLRDAVLEVRRGVPAHPGCESHRSRLAGYVSDEPDARARTAAAAHIEGCPSCTALANELVDVPRAFLQAIVPLFERAGACRDDGRGRRDVPPVTARPGLGVLGGVRRLGGGVAARVAAPVGGGVGVAAAAVAVVVVIAAVVGGGPPDGPGSVRELAGSTTIRPTPTTGPAAVPADGDGSIPAPLPGSRDPGPTPPAPARPGAGPSAPVPAAPAPDATAGSPPPAQPVATTSPVPPPAAPAPAPADTASASAPADTASASASASASAGSPSPSLPAEPDLQVAAVPTMGSVTWSVAEEHVQVTLVNGTSRATGALVLSLAALGGSFVSGRPSGCALGVGAMTTGLCALASLPPGASATVHVPVRVTGPGQSARVTLCSAAFLRLDCDTALLAPTTIALS